MASKESGDAFYKRHLPHYQPAEAEYHVVFRLAGSLPAEAIQQLQIDQANERSRVARMHKGLQKRQALGRAQAEYSAKFDRLLDNSSTTHIRLCRIMYIW